MKLTFKSKKEFAEAILKYGKLYCFDNDVEVLFAAEEENPFRTNSPISSNYPVIMNTTWNLFNEEWSATPPLKDKDLVWAWDSVYSKQRVVGFYNAVNNSLFAYDGVRCGTSWENIEKYEGEWPQWAIEAHKKLQD